MDVESRRSANSRAVSCACASSVLARLRHLSDRILLYELHAWFEAFPAFHVAAGRGRAVRSSSTSLRFGASPLTPLAALDAQNKGALALLLHALSVLQVRRCLIKMSVS